MDSTSEAILSLRPDSFRYNRKLDPNGIPQFGLIAEEVAKVNPDLVVTDDKGQPFSVRYEEVNAMLLNEFLKEHRKVEEQEKKLAKQEAAVDDLKSALRKQAAQLQQVNDRIEAVGPLEN